MRIAITGATGLIGSALTAHLTRAGHAVTPVVRRRPRTPGPHVLWDPAAGRIDAGALDGHDAVIHLAGESLAGLWTAGKKRRIRESRIAGTRLLAATLAGLERKPAVLVSASAAGYYGERPPDQPLDDDSPPGRGFLAEVTRAWEQAADAARQAGIRVVHPRFGMVLSGRGGALGPLLPLFRLGLGGRLGSGRQIWPWIAIDDVARGILHVLGQSGLEGGLNFVAPQATTNAEFTRTLARVLGRPTFLSVPAFALRLLPGGFADQVLLGGAWLVPRRLTESAYRFAYPELEPALRQLLRRPERA